MKHHKGLFPTYLISFVLIGCAQEIEPMYKDRLYTISAGLIDDATRVSLEPSSTSLDMIAKWQEDDEVKVLIYGKHNYLELPSISVRDISDDKKNCQFSFSIPEDYELDELGYRLVCYTIPPGSDNLAKPHEEKDNPATIDLPLIRYPIDQFRAPVLFSGRVRENNVEVAFHHLYTYELLHVENKTNLPVPFSLSGYNTTPLWFAFSSSLELTEETSGGGGGGAFSPRRSIKKTAEPVRESPLTWISPHTEAIIVSAYIPTGAKISDAQMVAVIDGNTVYSSNTISSDIVLETGHAYHMYATWDGQELKFRKDGEEPLDVRTLTASIDPQYLSGEFTGAVVNPPLSEIKTGFRFWKDNNPEDYVEYDSTSSDNSSFSLNLTYNDFVYIANESPVEGKYFVSAFAIDAKGTRHPGNVLEFTIESGQPVVPVIPDAVDLGLPSGTKWAPYNVGATKPQEVGHYYAWGEISPKSHYDWTTYQHADGTAETRHDIGNDISGSEYDAAKQIWGQNWSMPTVDQVRELFSNSSITWIAQEGMTGVEITSRINGNSIFLPVAGVRSEDELFGADRYCYYWTSIVDTNIKAAKCLLSYNSGETQNAVWGTRNEERCIGLPIRPVFTGSDTKVPVPEIVDLGLSVKWASFNLGASKPEDYGDYYAWGETEPYYSSLNPLIWKEGKEEGYWWPSYKWCMGSHIFTKYCTNSVYGYNEFTDNKTVLDPEDDAAHVNLGENWRLPTKEEQDELQEKCSWVWTQMNGVNGCKFTGPNGNSIFLPAAGYRGTTVLNNAGSGGYYWSLSLNAVSSNGVYDLYFNSDYVESTDSNRYCGFSVRPVYDDSDVKPEIKTPEPVDLGLPSGLKWASFNLGATKPEEYGDYYAWGEVETYYSSLDPLTWKEGKEAGYNWASYKWCMGTYSTLTKYCTYSIYGYNRFTDGKTVLDPEDDAAHVNLGGNWRMPTSAEWEELIYKCTWTWTTQNGVNGRRITGPNGNRIFLPAAGHWSDTNLYPWASGTVDSSGLYWSSSIYDLTYDAQRVYFFSGHFSMLYDYRYNGFSVRPVYDD